VTDETRPTLEELTANMDPGELRLKAGRSIQQWSVMLAQILSPDDAWRLLLGGALAAAGQGYTADEIAEMLRQAADGLETGQFRPSVQ
jgi:hypothetical protein